MGDIKIAIHVQGDKAASKITGEGKASEISLAISHLEMKKQELLELLKKHSDELTGRKK